MTEPLQAWTQDAVPAAETFVSGLEWLHSGEETDDLAIGWILLVDRSAILVSSLLTDSGEENAIFEGGFGNSRGVLSRRLIAKGLPGQGPSQH